jgi:hypothetical protein
MSPSSTILGAGIAGATQRVHDVFSGTANGKPFNNTTDSDVDGFGPLYLNIAPYGVLPRVPLEEQNGQWIPATGTETRDFTSFGDPGNATYTTTINASGLVTTVETGSFLVVAGQGTPDATTYQGTESLQETIDLSSLNLTGMGTYIGGMATYTSHRVINETVTSATFNQTSTEIQDRTASFPVFLSPVTSSFFYISPDQPTITAAHPNATFTVSLDHPLTYPVTVHYATKDGTAVAGADYTAESGDLSFAAGQLYQTISVPLLNNPTASGNAVFYVDLTNPSASGGAAPAISVNEATEAISVVPPTSVDTGISDNITQNADGTQTETQNVATATPNAPIYNSVFDANGNLVNASFKNEDGSSVSVNWTVDPTTDTDKFAGVTTSAEATPNAAEAANAPIEVVKQLAEDFLEVGLDFLKESKNPIVAAIGSQLRDAFSGYNNIKTFLDAANIGPLYGKLLVDYATGEDITNTATVLATTVATIAASATGIPFAGAAALVFIAFGNKFVSTAIDLYFEMKTQEGPALLANPVVLPGQVPGTPIQLGSGPDVAPQPVTGTPDSAGNTSYSVPAANPGETYNLDPSGSSTYTLVENAGSPKIDTVTLPALNGVSYYRVSAQTASGWSPLRLTAPNVPLILPDGTTGITIETLDSNYQAIVSNSPASIGLTFTGNGTFSGTLTSGSPPGPLSAIPSDFNGDGNSDIVLQNNDGTVDIWTMNGASITGGGVVANPGTSWHVITSGDFNADGFADILWQNDNGTPAIWEMNSTNVIGGGILPNPGSSWHVKATGDFNGEGYSDILWQNDSGDTAIWEMNGTNVIGGGDLGNPGQSWHVITTGDFNGDAHSDILWQSDSGEVDIWEMNGTNVIGGGSLGNPGPSWHALAAGDFNGDGKSDVVLQNNDGTVAIWDMSGPSVIGGGVVANPGANWHVFGTGDYNHDGKSDILLQASTGEVAVWEMNGTNVIGGGIIANPGPAWHIG